MEVRSFSARSQKPMGVRPCGPRCAVLRLLSFVLIALACAGVLAGCDYGGGVFELCAAYPNSDSNAEQIVLSVKPAPLLSSSDIKEIRSDKDALVILLTKSGVDKLKSIKNPGEAYLVFRSDRENLLSAKYIDIGNLDLQQRISDILYFQSDALYLFSFDKEKQKAQAVKYEALKNIKDAAQNAGITWSQEKLSGLKLAFYPADGADLNEAASESKITGPAVFKDSELDSMVYDASSLTLTVTAKSGSPSGVWKNFFSYDTCVIVVGGKAAHPASLVSGGIKIVRGYSIVKQGDTYELTYVREVGDDDSKAEKAAAEAEIKEAMETLLNEFEAAGLSYQTSGAFGGS